MKAAFCFWPTVIIGVFNQRAASGETSSRDTHVEIFSGNSQVYYPEPPDKNRCQKPLYELIAEGVGTNPSVFQASSQISLTQTAANVADGGSDGAQSFVSIALAAGNLNVTSDLVTGFISSRLMGMFFGESVAQVRDEQAYPLTRNMMKTGCRASAVSRKLDFDPPNTFCNLANIITILMACGSFNTTCGLEPTDFTNLGNSCPLMASEWTQEIGSFILNEIQTGTDNPSGMSIQQAARDEGFMYYMLLRALKLYSKEAICTGNRAYTPNFEVVPGWKKQAEFWLQEEGDSTAYKLQGDGIPLASLSQKQNKDTPYEPTCEFLLVIREPKTTWEWRQAFQAQLDPLSSVSGILVHRGLNFMSTAIVSPLVAYMNDKVFGLDGDLQGGLCTIENTKLMISGYSVAGGLAELIALKLSINYGEKLRPHVVTFGAPNSMDSAGYNYLSKRSNMRTIIHAMDPLPQFPCANGDGLFRCPAKSFLSMHGVGHDGSFGASPNIVEIDMNTMMSEYPIPLNQAGIGLASMSKMLDFGFWNSAGYENILGKRYCNQTPE